jgi:hypothetical protein
MSMDAITEKIAHFIGAFEQFEQEGRMRADYDKFRAIKAAEDDAEAIDLRSLKAKEFFKLEDVDAGVKFQPASFVKPPPPELDQAPIEAEGDLANEPPAPAPLLDQTENLTAPVNNSSEGTPNFILPPPSSMAQVTYQINVLSDNDSFGAVSALSFQAVESLIETLQNLYTAALQLSPLNMELLPTTADWSKVVSEIQVSAQALVTGVSGPLSTSVLIGEDAQGHFADGVAITEFTPFEELLPTYIAEKRAEAEADAEPHDHTTDGHDFSQDFGKGDNPYKVDEGHTVVAGANTLVNTASITSSWLDADVIAVSGYVLRMDAISQVNVIVDHDSITDALSPTNLADQSSIAANAAAIVVKSIATAKAEAAAEAGDAPDTIPTTAPTFANAPANWTVVRYDGPVTQVNWVKQHTFTTDNDQAVVTFSGAKTFLGLGENGLSNSFNAHEFGFQYDLILVGGNLIDINLVNQLNIILDSDVVDTIASEQVTATKMVSVLDVPEVSEEAAGPTSIQSMVEEPTQVAAPSVAPDQQIDVLHDTPAQTAEAQPAEVTGSAINGSSQEAAATSGLPDVAPADAETPDASVVEIAEAVPAAEDVGASSTPTAAVSTGDNLAYNQAMIQTIGQDTDAAISQIYADALDAFANGNDEISNEIVQDTAFAGTELLRVLYVDGDFTTVNMVDQVNVLGDADQVHLARDDFAAALQEQIKITTGSNVAANIAAIKDNGMDSVVMAQGGTYSDALIHQANLMDVDVLETGSSIADLTNEAVAFLTDDVNANSMGDDITAMTNGIINDAFSQTDIMQNMLS